MKKNILFAAVFILVCNLVFPQSGGLKGRRPWKGNAILGNGNMCFVYSDDPRIDSISGYKGIRHFYYRGYQTDYIASSSFEVYDKSGISIEQKISNEDIAKSIGLENSFCAATKTKLTNGVIKETRCYSHPKDGAIFTLKTGKINEALSYSFKLILRKHIITDKTVTLKSLETEKITAAAEWSDGACMLIALKTPGGKITVDDSIVIISSPVSWKEKNEIIIAVGSGYKEAKEKLKSILNEKDAYVTVSNYWNNWINKGKVPIFKNPNQETLKYLDYYKRNLCAVKAACLNGQIPADMTGQFMTNGAPQLYPRDAMQSARIFIVTGHYEEAKEIIKYWANPEIPKKNPGEFFARYDANAKAVDAGSGARYDEPEWDANGYFIQLINDYYKQKKIMLADNKFVFELADFLVNRIDKSGLFYEGGIVEWTGYLPATNMICAAGLKTAAQFAAKTGDTARAGKYTEACQTISNSLIKTFDKNRNAYSAVRFHGIKTSDNRSITDATKDTLYLWDVSANFGVLWGYPNHKEMELTNKFYQAKTQALNGGMQYFEASDNAGLSAYGGDVFFFTTAASAQYQALYGDISLAKKNIDWMIANSNSYGLMPERIYLNESDCSDASPLTWCNAEFAAAVLEWSKK
jgi:GH15 family glucan-1,4-alpha-glucosidase